ncbi:MAG: hypothetical protein IKX50_01610 [Spirochaetia bacterium]|nr:hypothetical protein [Spirochaetia bacterium]MBR5016403.1 hypothetical protein [Spirochaetia bacterium]
MFQIKVEGIFKISGRGQIITGPANEKNYQGTLRCGNKVFKVIGFPVFDISKDGCYLLDTFELTDAYIGKVFVEEKRSIEKQFIESNLDEADT